MRQIPKLLAVVVCEGVTEDVRTHNKCILNTFNMIRAADFPMVQDRLAVFVSLTDGHGNVPLEVRLVRGVGADPKDRIVSVNGTASFDNPLGVADIVLELRQVPFPRPGEYAVQIWAGEEMLGERRIHLSREGGEK